MRYRLLLALAPLLLSPARAEAPPRGTLDVRIEGLRSSRGKVGCTLYASEKGYPTDPRQALAEQYCAIAGATSRCRFPSLPPGEYALACYHDENDNRRMDFNLLHLPREGGGASRGARAILGPPRWRDARFDFAGRDGEEVVTIHY